MSVHSWSTQQQSIFLWFGTKFSASANHLIVRARAGTGKTTTIIEGIGRAPEKKILLAAFNKRIADELQMRIKNPNAKAKTLHSIGLAAVWRFWEGVGIDDERKRPEGQLSRADGLAEQVCGPSTPDAIKRMVSKLHTKAREIAPHANQPGDLVDIMINFDCEPDEQWAHDGFDGIFVETKALEAMRLAAQVKPKLIDYADMIYLPIRNRWLRPSYDLVVVDEAQDMTVAQLEIARGVCRGRICVVGDDMQAIYAFRGADSESLDRLKKELRAAELGLTVTYRCGRVIVELAKELVPDFQAGPNNPEGEIRRLHTEKLVGEIQEGDFLLSRVNAPLVGTAMKLLANGKRARIAGRDIGSGLKALIKKLTKGKAGNSIPAFLEKVATWRRKQVDRMLAAEQTKKADLINDQAEMLVALAENAKSVLEVVNRIDSLFTDNGLGAAGIITCSSVHRAKGLEADRVFLLEDTFRPSMVQEERNIRYVAITRAKKTLVWVSPNVAEEVA